MCLTEILTLCAKRPVSHAATEDDLHEQQRGQRQRDADPDAVHQPVPGPVRGQPPPAASQHNLVRRVRCAGSRMK